MRRAVQWSRDALDDLKAQISHIAADHPQAARRVAECVLLAAAGLGERSTGRTGRVAGTYEKLVARLPYVVAYAIMPEAQGEIVAILRVIHTARDWPAGGWPT